MSTNPVRLFHNNLRHLQALARQSILISPIVQIQDLYESPILKFANAEPKVCQKIDD